jgi:hypothetical protein
MVTVTHNCKPVPIGTPYTFTTSKGDVYEGMLTRFEHDTQIDMITLDMYVDVEGVSVRNHITFWPRVAGDDEDATGFLRVSMSTVEDRAHRLAYESDVLYHQLLNTPLQFGTFTGLDNYPHLHGALSYLILEAIEDEVIRFKAFWSL